LSQAAAICRRKSRFVATAVDTSQQDAIRLIRSRFFWIGAFSANFASSASSVRGGKYGFHTSHGSAIRRNQAQFVATGVALKLCDISSFPVTGRDFGAPGRKP
jgi:hypothetical protein